MESESLRAIMEVDQRCVRLQSLRDQLVTMLAILGGALWLVAAWPARFRILQPICWWLWAAASLATLIVMGREMAWTRRRDRLLGVRPHD